MGLKRRRNGEKPKINPSFFKRGSNKTERRKENVSRRGHQAGTRRLQGERSKDTTGLEQQLKKASVLGGGGTCGRPNRTELDLRQMSLGQAQTGRNERHGVHTSWGKRTRFLGVSLRKNNNTERGKQITRKVTVTFFILGVCQHRYGEDVGKRGGG